MLFDPHFDRRIEMGWLAVGGRLERLRRFDREPLAAAFVPLARQPALGRVDVEPPLVQARPLADREEAEVVRVVGDEEDARLHRLAVELGPDSAPLAQAQPESPGSRERLAPPAVPLAPVDKRSVEAEREVVQEAAVADPPDVDAPLVAPEGIERGGGVVDVEPEVAREVVPRSERNADERQVALNRYGCDAGHGAVAAG